MMATDCTYRAGYLDYLSAYLTLAWQANLDTGLYIWVKAFKRALDGWLNGQAKTAVVSPEAI
jgi:hypothetical protein